MWYDVSLVIRQLMSLSMCPFLAGNYLTIASYCTETLEVESVNMERDLVLLICHCFNGEGLISLNFTCVCLACLSC